MILLGGRQRTLVLTLTLAASSGAALFLGACLLADPAPEVPSPPALRPTILHGAVFPQSTHPITDLPEFIVPVQLADPGRVHEWRVFVDFDPLGNPDDFVEQRGTTGGDPNADNLQRVFFTVNAERFRTGCHRITFVVALRFDGARPASAELSDSVTWFYLANGGLSGCTSFPGDAAVDARFPDAETDG